MGDAFSCNSGSIGTPSAEWYRSMTVTFEGAVRMKEGDMLEIRLMADQASSNEDVGVAKVVRWLWSVVVGDLRSKI